MSSTINQQAIGKSESAVKSAKRLMQKNKNNYIDQFLALFDFRNTSLNTAHYYVQKAIKDERPCAE